MKRNLDPFVFFVFFDYMNLDLLSVDYNREFVMTKGNS